MEAVVHTITILCKHHDSIMRRDPGGGNKLSAQLTVAVEVSHQQSEWPPKACTENCSAGVRCTAAAATTGPSRPAGSAACWPSLSRSS